MENENYTTTPIIQSEKQPQKNKKRSESCRYCFFCWLLSIFIWGFIILFLYYLLFEKKKRYEYLFINIPAYIIYFILELCSESNKYLCRKRKNKEIKLNELLESLFKAQPNVSVYCECSHTESEYVSDGDEGHYETSTVVSYSENVPIKYYSCRDVSGLFVLNVNEKNINKKAYIKLELNTEINFADTVSYKENEFVKMDLTIRNKNKDRNFSIKELRSINGMRKHYFLRLQDKEPKCFHYMWFLLFTILTFAEFYKIYNNSICIYQNFTIRKFVSTRYDLSSDEYTEKYEKFNPQIKIMDQHISYDPSTFTHVISKNKKPMPTEAEILECKIFEPKIPKYEIYSGSDIHRAGTIKDISYQDYKVNNIQYNNNLEKQTRNDNINIPLNILNNDISKEQNNNDDKKLLP